MAVLSLFAGKQGGGKGYKAVYLAPSKFLVVQKVVAKTTNSSNFSNASDILKASNALSTSVCNAQYQEWEQKFEKNFGLRLAEVTGDTSTSNQEMANADIILSTPEKVRCRKPDSN